MTRIDVKQKEGYCLSPSLSTLEPVLKKWVEIVNLSALHDRPPYPNGERTDVGLLSASVWCSGGVAFEEIMAEKAHKHGRPDLWFRYRGSDYLAEAKFVDLGTRRLLRNKTVSRSIEEQLLQAEDTARSSVIRSAGTSLALTFAHCWLRIDRTARAAEYRLNCLTGALELCSNVLAWTFPDQCLRAEMHQPRWSSEVKPYVQYGTVIVGREVAGTP